MTASVTTRPDPVIKPLWDEYLAMWQASRRTTGLDLTVAEVEAARTAFYAAMFGFTRAMGGISQQYPDPKQAVAAIRREAEAGCASR